MSMSSFQILVLLNIASIAVTAIGFFVIKFNDLRHLGKDVVKMEKRLENIELSVSKHTVNFAKLSAKCEERHGN